MKKFDDVEEIIGQAIFDNNIHPEEFPNVHNYLDMAKNAYVLVQWPESQEYMEGNDWFEEEAILNINEPAAYFIPIKRLI